MFITIDDYYNTEFYNECIEALKNNRVDFNQFISSKAPYKFYFEIQNPPTFINYDNVSESYARYLVNITKALTPNEDYKYLRRDSFSNTKALEQYCINDALSAGQKSNEGVFFTGTRDEVLRISRDYPRKIWYMGRYFNRRYMVFFADKLIVKNFLDEKNVLIDGSGFKYITELETELNYKVFHLKDRLVKLSQTPYIQKGQFYPINSVRPEITDRYVLS